MKARLFLLGTFSIFIFKLNAQSIELDSIPSDSILSIVETYFEDQYSGLDVFNVTFTGDTNAIGLFSAGNSNFFLDEGILLTTGHYQNAAGPNDTSNTTFDNNGGTDATLESLVNFSITDAISIEFDFVSCNSTFEMEYVFASEEYPEYVGANLMDVLGVFITGPTPVGNNYINTLISIIPGTPIAVSINNVNSVTNSSFFRANIPGSPVHNIMEYDGMTVAVNALANIVPCETYHLKIAIGDGADPYYDSGLFLRRNPNTPNAQVFATVNTTSCPGMNDGSIFIDSVYGTPPFFYQWSNSVFADSIVNLDPGVYFVSVTDGNGDLTIMSYEVAEPDALNLSLTSTLINPNISPSGMIDAIVTGGTSPYAYLWSDGSTSEDLTQAAYGNHDLTVTDFRGCETSGHTFVDLAIHPSWTMEYSTSVHQIDIPLSANLMFNGAMPELYDFIGVFYQTAGILECAGYVVWLEDDASLFAYADDTVTAQKDGFDVNEYMIWQYWDIDDQFEYDLFPYFNNTYPDTDLFQLNGHSAIDSLKTMGSFIKDQASEPIKIFPNPVTDVLTIEFPNHFIEVIKIYDIYGKLILLKNDIKSRTVQLSVQEFPDGIYTIEVNEAFTERIIKM